MMQQDSKSIRFPLRILELGIVTSALTVLRIGPLQISDILLFGALGLLLLAGRRHQEYTGDARERIRSGLAVTIIGIILTALLTELAAGHGYSSLSVALRFGSVLVAFPYLLSAAVIPKTELKRLALFLCLSGAVNGTIAALDQWVGTNIGPMKYTWNDYRPLAIARAVGMTEHPNLLGYSGAVTGTVAMAFISSAQDQRSRRLAGYMLVPIVAGVIASGSRAALIGLFVGGMAVWRYRPKLKKGRTIESVVATCLVAFAAAYAAGIRLDRSTFGRVVSDRSSQLSDVERRNSLTQYRQWLFNSVLVGRGYENLRLVHSAPLAVYLSGGIFALLAVAAWVRLISRAGATLRATPDPTLQLLGCAGVAGLWSAISFLTTQPMIFHRYAILPASLILAGYAQVNLRNTAPLTKHNPNLRRIP
jgi:hypothetical protein